MLDPGSEVYIEGLVIFLCKFLQVCTSLFEKLYLLFGNWTEMHIYISGVLKEILREHLVAKNFMNNFHLLATYCSALSTFHSRQDQIAQHSLQKQDGLLSERAIVLMHSTGRLL